jgi:uncharacterized membrane protein
VFEVLSILAFIFALIAFRRSDKLERQVYLLKAEIQRLAAERPSTWAAKPTDSVEPLPDAVSAEVADTPKQIAAEQISPEPLPDIPETEDIVPPLPKPSRRGDFEQRLASRWLVWLGGAAVAVGGLLFIQYAHEANLIPPVMRVIFGLAVAAGLVFFGERVRLSAGERFPSFVPAALSAAGLVIAFGVIYAAYALYELLSPGLCFPLLVAVGLLALWLSRRQGPLIAALGLLGAFVAPMLVSTNAPNPWGFFAYLLVIVAACFYELRSRPWWWLGFAAIAGATAWSVLWANSGYSSGTVGLLPPTLFALALGGLAAFMPRGKAVLTDEFGSLASLKHVQPPLWLTVAGFAAASVILAAFVYSSQHSTVTLAFFLIGMAGLCAFSWLKQDTSFAALAAGVFTWVVFMGWPGVGFHEPAFDERGFWVTVPGLVEPPRFVMWMAIAGGAFTALGFWGAIRRERPIAWAMLAAFSSFAFLFGAWARAEFVMPDAPWIVIAAGLALAMVALAWLRKDDAAEVWNFGASDVALASSALLALFIADRMFDGVWLTLAIAAIAAGYAYGSRMLPAYAMGPIAAGVATLASLKLFVARELRLENSGLPLGDHWPLYGYGVPALLFWFASRWLNRERWPRWSIGLEGLSLGLLIALVSVELRVLIAGEATADSFSLLELGAHATAWLGAAYGLAYRQEAYSGFISKWGATALIAAASLMLLVGLVVNPAFTGDRISGNAFFNDMTLAYLLPVPIIALIAPKLGGLGLEKMRNPFGILALVLLLAYVTLEIMRIYQGPRLTDGFESDAEGYTVSMAWLALAILVFVAGMRLSRQAIRYGGLALLVLTVLKVFLFDFSDLGGLWRIASLMGLGLCLIGIGWLYTRYVQPQRDAADAQSLT